MVKQTTDDKGVRTVPEEAVLFLELKGENPFKVKSGNRMKGMAGAGDILNARATETGLSLRKIV